MEKEMVTVVSTVNGVIGIYLPDLRFKKEWTKKGQRQNIDKELLKQELKNLNDREKQIMTLRYGLNETEEYTQKEVAEMLGISQSYISRIEKKIIKKLKTLMEIN